MQGAAVLKDAHAQRFGGARQPKRVLQRVQVAALGVEQAGLVALGGDVLPQICLAHKAQAVVTPLVRGLFLPIGEQVHATLQHRGPDMARPEVAGDLVLRNAAADFLCGLLRQAPDGARAVQPQRLLERRHVAGKPKNDLTTVAPGGAPADATGLQQHDALASLGQPQRAVQAGVAGADDEDVGLQRLLQVWAHQLLRTAAGGVVAVHMLEAAVKHGAVLVGGQMEPLRAGWTDYGNQGAPPMGTLGTRRVNPLDATQLRRRRGAHASCTPQDARTPFLIATNPYPVRLRALFHMEIMGTTATFNTARVVRKSGPRR